MNQKTSDSKSIPKSFAFHIIFKAKKKKKDVKDAINH